MIFQVFQNKTSKPIEQEATFEELAETLTDIQETDKEKASLPCWSPCRLSQQWRTEKNVIDVQALVLDCDDFSAAQWAHFRAKLEGINWFYASTYSYSPVDGELRFRAVARLSRPVPCADWRRFYRAMVDELGISPGDRKKLWQTSDPCRLYFASYCPVGAPTDFDYFEGEPIDVDFVLEHAPAYSKLTGDVAPQEKSERELTIDELRRIVPKYVRKIENTVVRKGYEALELALNGQSFAPHGERDNTLLAMSGILSKEFPFTAPEAIVAPIRAALDIGDDEPGWAPDALVQKIRRDQEKLDAERAKKGERTLSGTGRTTQYTREEIDGWCKELNLTPEQLTEQLIVSNGQDYFWFWNGDYRYASGQERAQLGIRSALPLTTGALDVAMGEEGPKGWIPKQLDRLFQDYGRYAFGIRKDLRLQQSYYDGETFHYAVCPRDKKLEPKFSKLCQDWLEGWNSPEAIDWIATAPKLELATAALILDGEKRTGKSQLAKGLARVWGATRPTSLHALHSAFNEDMSRCPIVYAEETIPWEFRRDTGLLKELITSSSQQLRAKYQANAELVGHLRLVIARNDHKLFEAGEALTPATVAALTDRLLYVNTGSHPAPHIEDTEVAQHILWLMEHHKVQPSARPGLWVTGRPSRLHYRMRAFTSKVSVSVCEWLCRFLANPTMSGDTGGQMFRLDSQGLKVSPQLIYQRWSVYADREHGQPTRAQVVDALDGIATRHGQLFKIDLDVLAEYAESMMHPWATKEELQSAIEGAGIRAGKAAN